MKKLNVYLFIYTLFVLSISISTAQQTSQKFIKQIDYLLYLPKGYDDDTSQKWPLVLFLHGSGESGVDLEKVKMHGLPKLIASGKEFPFIVISPQAQRGWKAEYLYDLLMDVKKKYRVDYERIYLTGLSMGGFGTWDLAQKYPQLFAAIVPICGGGDQKDIWKLRNTAIWCFHGAKDPVVPLRLSEEMINAVKLYNSNVKFTIYPEALHNSWSQTYDDPQLYEWLLKQKKFKYTQVNISSSLLNDYVGKYKTPGGDTVEIYLENEKLKVKQNERNRYELKPASDTKFFVMEEEPIDLTFLRNDKGEVDRILFMGWSKDEFTKINRK